MGGRKTLVWTILLGVLLLDQGLKVWVKTHMYFGEEIQFLGTDWALLHFVENDGMAFGLSFGGRVGKFLLTLFRAAAVVLLAIYLRGLLRLAAPRLLLAAFALIEAGAVGNIIDSIFYGRLFSATGIGEEGVADFLPQGGGYAGLFFGRVVDMLYFPVAYGVYPDWLPVLGGEPYLFFRPIFNLADVAITLGLLVLLVHYFTGKRQTEAA